MALVRHACFSQPSVGEIQFQTSWRDLRFFQPAKSSDDLLQLSGNPFASVLNSAAAPAPAAAAAPAVAPAAAASGGFNFGAGFPDTANANGTQTKLCGDKYCLVVTVDFYSFPFQLWEHHFSATCCNRRAHRRAASTGLAAWAGPKMQGPRANLFPVTWTPALPI